MHQKSSQLEAPDKFLNVFDNDIILMCYALVLQTESPINTQAYFHFSAVINFFC